MKCTFKKKNGQECRADLLPIQNFCEVCGNRVIIDYSKLRKCPSCNTLVKLCAEYCTNCGQSVANEEKIVCQGKKKNGSDCKRELTKNDNFCSQCGTRNSVSNSALDRNEYAQRPQGKVPEGGGEKDDHENDLKVGSMGVHGKGHGSETPHSDIEKDVPEKYNESSESFEDQLETASQTEERKRGLAVICVHGNFDDHKTHPTLDPRKTVSDDLEMMTNTWKSCGFEVLKYEDQKNEFYDKILNSDIEEKLNDMGEIDHFVFCLSTHGGEGVQSVTYNADKQKVEKTDEANTIIQHYFFTNDLQYNTQDLMDSIAKITQLKNKLKLFFIQACRCRSGRKEDNVDFGKEIKVSLPEKKTEDGVDAKSHNDKNYTVFSDARGDVLTQDDEEDLSISPEAENEYCPPFEVVPHCNNSIVVFASMAGKFAYRLISSPNLKGGWLLMALAVTLNQYKPGEKIDIMEMVTEVNRQVGTKKATTKRKFFKNSAIEMNSLEKSVELKAQSCFFHNLAVDEESLFRLKTEVPGP